MPSKLDAPVLTVDVGLVHKIDTRNVENLFSMWTVFSRCAGSLEEGRRLENLSWRLWNREIFCCDPVSEANSTTPAISIASRSPEGYYSSDVPSLSRSLDSVASNEEAIEFDSDSSTSAALDIVRPRIVRQDSTNSNRSRGRERHITPVDLEKMVVTIKEKKDLTAPFPLETAEYLAPLANRIEESKPVTTSIPEITTSATDSTSTHDASQSSSRPDSTDSGSVGSLKSTTSVVRGFSPSHVSSSYRSIPLLTAPSSIPTTDLTDAPASKGPQPERKSTKFVLGGSSGDDSMSDREASIDNKMVVQQQKKKPVFTFGGSSNEDESSLSSQMQTRSALTSSRPHLTKEKKQTSFLEEVASRTIAEEQPFDDDVFESDDDDIDESAIDDDDDSSDWEDSPGDSRSESIDDKTFFQRVDSRLNLTSRRSLITTMLHQNDRANALATAATAASQSTSSLQRSRTSSPNGPSMAASPDSDDAAPLMMKKGLKSIPEIPRSAACPIIQKPTNITHQQALSPRTTRRNMLASELTVSLRQHLLWERKQKSQTATAVMKRRHTTQDVANLTEYPKAPYMNGNDHKGFFDVYNEGLGEYHSRGW